MPRKDGRVSVSRLKPDEVRTFSRLRSPLEGKKTYGCDFMLDNTRGIVILYATTLYLEQVQNSPSIATFGSFRILGLLRPGVGISLLALLLISLVSLLLLGLFIIA